MKLVWVLLVRGRLRKNSFWMFWGHGLGIYMHALWHNTKCIMQNALFLQILAKCIMHDALFLQIRNLKISKCINFDSATWFFEKLNWKFIIFCKFKISTCRNVKFWAKSWLVTWFFETKNNRKCIIFTNFHNNALHYFQENKIMA